MKNDRRWGAFGGRENKVSVQKEREVRREIVAERKAEIRGADGCVGGGGAAAGGGGSHILSAQWQLVA